MKWSPRLRRLIFGGVVVLALLIVGYCFFENRRGAKEWEEAQARAAEAGVSLVRADYAGPEIPDEENLLKNEVFMKALEDASVGRLGHWWDLFADSFDREKRADGDRRKPKRKLRGPRGYPKTGTFCDYRVYFEADLTEEEALALMSDRTREMNMRLDELVEVILKTPVHHVFAREAALDGLFERPERYKSIVRIVSSLGSSARLSICLEDSTRAVKIIRALDRLGRMIRAPEIIDYLQSSVIAATGVRLIREGLFLKRWSYDQMEALEEMLGQRDGRAEYTEVLEYQAAFHLELLNTYLREDIDPQRYQDGRAHAFWKFFAVGGPQGWDDRRRSFVTNFYLDCLSSVKAGLSLELDQLQKRFEGTSYSPLFFWHYLLEVELHVSRNFERTETAKRIALIALALGKVKLTTGKYPTQLSEVKEGLELVDLTDPERRELAYELGPEGRPVIWSIHEQEQGVREEDLLLRWRYGAKEE